MLRGLDLRRSPRTRAATIQEKIHEESMGDTTLDHLYTSPIEVTEDMRECNRMAMALKEEANRQRIDGATLNRLWSQIIHLTARLDRIITAGEVMKRNKYEMLFWAENIRERIERQRTPDMEFIPCVEIQIQYQRIPAAAYVEDVSEPENIDRREIDALPQRLKSVSPIEPIRHAKSSTPFTSTSTPATTEMPPERSFANPAATIVPSLAPSGNDMQQWRNPSGRKDSHAQTIHESESDTPFSVLEMAEMLRNEARQRLRESRIQITRDSRTDRNERVATNFDTTGLGQPWWSNPQTDVKHHGRHRQNYTSGAGGSDQYHFHTNEYGNPS